MDADERGSLSPDQAKRVRRSFAFMLFNVIILVLVIMVLFFELREKDDQLDQLMDKCQSLVNTTEKAISRLKQLENK